MEATQEHKSTEKTGRFAYAWTNKKEIWLKNDRTLRVVGPFRNLSQAAGAIGKDPSYLHQQIKRGKTSTKEGWSWEIKEEAPKCCPHCGMEIKP
jgi:hypothetical protein